MVDKLLCVSSVFLLVQGLVGVTSGGHNDKSLANTLTPFHWAKFIDIYSEGSKVPTIIVVISLGCLKSPHGSSEDSRTGL